MGLLELKQMRWRTWSQALGRMEEVAMSLGQIVSFMYRGHYPTLAKATNKTTSQLSLA